MPRSLAALFASLLLLGAALPPPATVSPAEPTGDVDVQPAMQSVTDSVGEIVVRNGTDLGPLELSLTVGRAQPADDGTITVVPLGEPGLVLSTETVTLGPREQATVPFEVIAEPPDALAIEVSGAVTETITALVIVGEPTADVTVSTRLGPDSGVVSLRAAGDLPVLARARIRVRSVWRTVLEEDIGPIVVWPATAREFAITYEPPALGPVELEAVAAADGGPEQRASSARFALDPLVVTAVVLLVLATSMTVAVAVRRRRHDAP